MIKTRRDLRCRFEYSLCEQTQLLETDLLGSALVIDGDVILACCKCLGYTRIVHAAWHGDAIVCSRCDAQRDYLLRL